MDAVGVRHGARAVLAPDPDTIGRLFGPLFRQWYLAL
jgi:hypothetical protein